MVITWCAINVSRIQIKLSFYDAHKGFKNSQRCYIQSDCLEHLIYGHLHTCFNKNPKQMYFPSNPLYLILYNIYFVSINFLFNIIFNHACQLSDGINKDIKVDIDSLKYTPCLEIMTGFVSKCDNLIALKLLWWFASTGRSPFIEYSSHTQNIKGNCNWLSLSYIEGYYKTISALFLWLFFYQCVN